MTLVLAWFVETCAIPSPTPGSRAAGPGRVSATAFRVSDQLAAAPFAMHFFAMWSHECSDATGMQTRPDRSIDLWSARSLTRSR